MALSESSELQRALLTWWDENARSFPWRDHDATPYEVLLAEVLLAKKRASEVEPVYRAVLDQYPDLDAMANADHNRLADVLRPLGLQNRRASALIAIAETCKDSGLPQVKEHLLELPFVGRYIACATLCFAFGETEPIVDSNVARVYSRLYSLPPDPQSDRMWALARERVPEDKPRAYNLALLDFAAEVCTHTAPSCEKCPLRDGCNAYPDIIG